MCGIVAIYHPQGCVSSEALSRATARLHHRGPDGHRQWVAPHGRVGLGHARLSIIDLVTGDQPIVNEDGRRHIVVNGEFYDFERIQGELTRAGHRLRTRSDSEIALHLYEDLGPQCLHRLRGEYRLRAVGRGPAAALRRSRPVRHQAALLRLARRSIVPRLRGQGAVRGRGAGPLEPRRAVQCLDRAVDEPGRNPLRGVSPRCHRVTTCWPARTACGFIRYWDFDYPVASNAAGRALGSASGRRCSERHWTMRSSCAFGPMSRWDAT